MYVCRHIYFLYIKYMHVYICVFMYAYVNMDMHGHILCLYMCINTDVLDIHIYVSIYVYMLYECIPLGIYIGLHE